MTINAVLPDNYSIFVMITVIFNDEQVAKYKSQDY